MKSFTQSSSGELKYRPHISSMASQGLKSIVVDYEDLTIRAPDHALELVEDPRRLLATFDAALFEVLFVENPQYAERVKTDLRVRVRDFLDMIPLRSIPNHVNRFVMVSELVTRASPPMPCTMKAVYFCPDRHRSVVEYSLRKPVVCEGEGCDSKEFFLVKEESTFGKYQLLRIQEVPKELPPGRIPESIDVRVEEDLIGNARPGDRVKVTGIVDIEISGGRYYDQKSMHYQLICNYVEPVGKSPEDIEISNEELETIRA